MQPEPEYHVGEIVEIIKTKKDPVRTGYMDNFIGLICRIYYIEPWSETFGYLYKLEPEDCNGIISAHDIVNFIWSKESLVLAEDKDYINDVSDNDIFDFIGGNYEI